MADRRDRSVAERLEARAFDDPQVRAYLDTLSVETVEYRLGTPRVITIYAQPLGHWRVGDGRPSLANEDPAVMEAIGRCATARTPNSTSSPAST